MKAKYCMLRGDMKPFNGFTHEVVYNVDSFNGVYRVGERSLAFNKLLFLENFFECQQDGTPNIFATEVKEVNSKTELTYLDAEPFKVETDHDRTIPELVIDTKRDSHLTALDVIKKFEVDNNYYVGSAVVALLNGKGSVESVRLAHKFLDYVVSAIDETK